MSDEQEAELRAEARLFVALAHTEAGRSEAAYRLGLVRGYREVLGSKFSRRQR